MKKDKITVTLNQDTIQCLDTLAKQSKRKRSHLVEEAIQLWQEKQVEQEMMAGYLAMAEEDKKMAELNLAVGLEALKKP